MKRKITTYGGYFERFIETLSTKELFKLNYIISLLETEDRIPIWTDCCVIQWIREKNTKDAIWRNRKGIKN